VVLPVTLDLSRVPEEWAARGFSCAVWVDPPDQVWADFVHHSDELVMPIEGTLELSFLGRTLRLSPGEEVLIPARASHTVRNVGGMTARWYYGYWRGK
jgi:mannose-6-phosphate isomerase-like protein (cupin superfamily)